MVCNGYGYHGARYRGDRTAGYRGRGPRTDFRPTLSLSLRGWLALTVGPADAVDMIEELQSETTATCDDPDCERPLSADPALVFRTDAGERRAYECDCGALTVTVARGPESTR